MKHGRVSRLLKSNRCIRCCNILDNEKYCKRCNIIYIGNEHYGFFRLKTLCNMNGRITTAFITYKKNSSLSYSYIKRYGLKAYKKFRKFLKNQ